MIYLFAFVHSFMQLRGRDLVSFQHENFGPKAVCHHFGPWLMEGKGSMGCISVLPICIYSFR